MSDIAKMIAIAKKFGGGSGGGTSGSAPVVILPETVFPKLDDGFYADEGHVGLEELAIYPEIGKRYDVTVNGEAVTLPATAADAYDLQDACNIVLYDGSNPFAIGIAFPEKVEANGGVVSIMSFDESWNPDSVTLSIVLKEDNASSGGNAGGGGVFVVNGVVEINGAPDELGNFYGTIDKTPEEIANAHNAGQIVQLRCALTGALNGTAVMNVSADVDGMLAWEGIMLGMYFAINMEGGSRISLQIMQLQMTNPFG